MLLAVGLGDPETAVDDLYEIRRPEAHQTNTQRYAEIRSRDGQNLIPRNDDILTPLVPQQPLGTLSGIDLGVPAPTLYEGVSSRFISQRKSDRITASKIYRPVLHKNNDLSTVKERCEEVGALLILDEIQPGFGRTGSFFGFDSFNVIPDIVVMGKGMGGGLPIGAFSSSKKLMVQLENHPKLGHITTFGGNSVIAAAALATLKEIRDSDLIKEVHEKEALFRKELNHPMIRQINGKGLMLAPLLESKAHVNEVIFKCMEKGLILFWLLWEKKAIRISPPLTISKKEIQSGCAIIRGVLDKL